MDNLGELPKSDFEEFEKDISNTHTHAHTHIDNDIRLFNLFSKIFLF